MNGIIFCVCSKSAISVPSKILKRCRKEHQKMQVKKVSSLEKTQSESQNVFLSLFNVQQTGTKKPVMLASSSNSSGWNNDDKWSSHVWKSGEMSNTSTGRPVDDKFVIDDDMDSDTATESNFSLRSWSFLNRVNDRLRKMLDHSPEDAMRDIDKRSMIWNVFVFNIGSICIHGKNYSDNLHSVKNTGEDLTLKQMFEISEQLRMEQSDEIFGVSQISWESSPWKK